MLEDDHLNKPFDDDDEMKMEAKKRKVEGHEPNQVANKAKVLYTPTFHLFFFLSLFLLIVAFSIY